MIQCIWNDAELSVSLLSFPRRRRSGRADGWLFDSCQPRYSLRDATFGALREDEFGVKAFMKRRLRVVAGSIERIVVVQKC